MHGEPVRCCSLALHLPHAAVIDVDSPQMLSNLMLNISGEAEFVMDSD
jgi:hypothetical protein